MLNDGDRFYIVIENPTDKTKKEAIQFVSGLMGIQPRDETPEGVLPAKLEPYEIPDNLPEATEGKETKKVKIPYIGNVKTFNEWYLKYNEVDTDNQSILLSNCRKFMNRYLRNVQRENIKAVSKFLIDFEPILKNMQRTILKRNGYSELKPFLENEKEDNIQAAYDACRKAICQQLDIE